MVPMLTGAQGTASLQLAWPSSNHTFSRCRHYFIAPTAWTYDRGSPRPRVAELSTAAAPASIPPCVSRKDDSFHLTQCSRLPLVPRARIPAAAGGSFGVLLAISREHDAPLLSQAERILLQLRAARRFGLAPVAYLGERVFTPIGCESPTPSRYFDRAAGENIWDYFFRPVSDYSLFRRPPGRRAVRVFVASTSKGERYTDSEADVDKGADKDDEIDEEVELDEVEALPPFEGLAIPPQAPLATEAESEAAWTKRVMGAEGLQAKRGFPTSSLSYAKLSASKKRRIRMARLVRRYLRIHPTLLANASRLLKPWRTSASSIVGIALPSASSASSSEAGLEAIHSILENYLNNESPGSVVLVVGGGAAQLSSFRRRHGEKNVVAQPEGCTIGVSSAVCTGRREIIDALLLAHSDLAVSVSREHPAVHFASWYNPRLPYAPAASGSEGIDAAFQLARNALVDGTAENWTKAMLVALDDVNSTAFIPGLSRLPPKPVKKVKQKQLWLPIEKGECKDHKARRMDLGECQAYASAAKKHFIGTSTDTGEYPGCTLWEDNNHVEFNNHDNERIGCVQAPRGKCVCMLKTPK